MTVRTFNLIVSCIWCQCDLEEHFLVTLRAFYSHVNAARILVCHSASHLALATWIFAGILVKICEVS
jgi:hypothetical protein